MGTVVTERQSITGRTGRERGMGVCAGRGRRETQRLPCEWHLCSARISAQGKRNQGGWGLSCLGADATVGVSGHAVQRSQLGS